MLSIDTARGVVEVRALADALAHGKGSAVLSDGAYCSLPANDPLITKASFAGAVNAPTAQPWYCKTASPVK